MGYAHINTRIRDTLKQRFENEILENGEIPKVQWSKNGVFKSYSMFEYSENWAKFCRLVDKKMKENVGEGVFTRKYNKALLAQVENIAKNINGEDVINQQERFRTWMD
jgi:hypothetical protein